MNTLRFLGLDVHAESIVIAVAEAGDRPAEVWKTTTNDPAAVLRKFRRLGPLSSLKVCYEAGPTGFGLQRYLREQGVDCAVIAPSLVPVQSGCRVKTDRRDARNLAHYLRSGNLTPIWIPDEHTEAMRDLERAREDARLSERRARQQLLKFLLRHDRKFTAGRNHWTQIHWSWVRQQRFSHEALNRVLGDYIQAAEQATERVRRLTQDIAELIEGWALAPLVKNFQAFHGIQLVTAVGLSAEIGNFERFEKATQFMAFVGLVPSESSTGTSRKQGGITKTGNRHVRRLLIEAAWHYYDVVGATSVALQKRREGVPPEIVAIADKARRRLGRKAFRLRKGHKTANKIVTALARELAGFLWAAARASQVMTQKETPAESVGRNRGRGGRRLRENLEFAPASATPTAPAT